MTLFNVHCLVHVDIQYTASTEYTAYSTLYAVYSIHSTQYTVHYTQYTVHCYVAEQLVLQVSESNQGRLFPDTKYFCNI